jgi:hypothetical protein
VRLPGLRGLGVIEVEERRTARGGYPRWEGTPPTAWTRSWDRVYCCPTAAKPPNILSGAFLFLWVLQVKRRADERTRTADLSSSRVIIHAVHKVAWWCKTPANRH